MRRLLLAGLLGTLPAFVVIAVTATAVETAVAASSKSVTLNVAPKVLVFGNRITLSGAVTPAKSNQSVNIQARACGQTSATPVLGVRTGPNGTYSAGQAPSLNTVYQAQWHSVASAAVRVLVRPKIKLEKLARRRFRVQVTAARSLAGRSVIFQRRSSRKWSTVRNLRLRNMGQVVTTAISGRVFRSKVRKRRKIRIRLSAKQASPCYVGGRSNIIHS